jgi:hypothetical protein
MRHQRQIAVRGLMAAAICCLMTVGVISEAGAAAATTPGTTWMGGPGCGGKIEWRQHPATFPYFCDGAAVVEHVRWSKWGKPTATAHATMNEADLSAGTSVAAAPRVHRAITITASRIEMCSGRRAYTSVRIRLDNPNKGRRVLQFGTFLPHCSATSAPPGASSPLLWTVLEGKVWCGPTAPPLRELLCQSKSVPPPPTPADYGDPGFVFLHTTGQPQPARVSQLLWHEHQTPTPLAAGASWSSTELQITCRVSASNVRCSNASSNGFTITQTGYSAF